MKYCPYCMSELTEQDAQCPVCHRAPQDYQSPPHALRQGAMLNNRYLVGGIIGEGGFGITYIGLDTLLQFRVAIKEFFPNGMVNRNNTVSNEVLSISTESAKELFSKSRENFLREARTLAKFTDEAGVVAVRDFFEENRTVYIVMEYLDGITLKSYLKQVGNISPYNTVCLLMPVFRSLRKIHAKGLIHRGRTQPFRHAQARLRPDGAVPPPRRTGRVDGCVRDLRGHVPLHHGQRAARRARKGV